MKHDYEAGIGPVFEFFRLSPECEHLRECATRLAQQPELHLTAASWRVLQLALGALSHYSTAHCMTGDSLGTPEHAFVLSRRIWRHYCRPV